MAVAEFFRSHHRPAAGRLIDAVRALQTACLNPELEDERLEHACRTVEAVVADLGPELPVSRYPSEGVGSFMATHPVIGRVNAVAPPLTVSHEDGKALATGTYGPSYEGPRGAVQGGHIAAGFDIVLSYGAVLEGLVGYTGSLSVRYHRPTPIGRPVRYEGWCEQVRGRKAEISGHLLLDDGTRTASATGVFVSRASDAVDS